MDAVAVDADRRSHDFATVIVFDFGLLHALRTAFDSLLVGVASVVHPQRNVANAVAMLADVLSDRSVGRERRRHQKPNLVLCEQIRNAVPNACLWTAISYELKAERRLIVVCGLFRISDVKLDVVCPVYREDV